MATPNRYEVLIYAKLADADLLKQIAEVQNKANKKLSSAGTTKTGIKLKLDTEHIEQQMTRWRNRIKDIKTLHPAAAAMPEVQKELDKLEPLFAHYQKTAEGVYEINTAFTTVTSSVKKANTSFQNLQKDGQGLIKDLGVAFRKVVQWGLVTGVIYGTLRALKEGIQYVKDLNKEMTNIQIVTGMNGKQIKSLITDYSDLAQQMGATTLEIAKGSLEWFRQGKTAQEAVELTKASIMMSKLGNVEAAQSTEYLTSTLNGFKLEAEDATTVIDKLVALDNDYATSVAEIAEALQKSSNSAQQAGVSFDELASYITVISSITRQSGESIGTSLRTMFARMQNIKLGKMFEDEATNINDVEKALSLVDITLRETSDTFRPMGDVLDEISSKWSTLSTTEQSALATTIAGIRQRENFLVLMNNYNEVLIAQAVELNSAGLALQRYEIYLGSIEATANKNAAALERMWQTTISSGLVKWSINATTGIYNLIAAMGGLIPVLTVVIALLSTIPKASFAANLSGLAGGLTKAGALGAALWNPYALAIVAITAAIGGLIYLSGSLDRTIQKNVDSINEVNKSISATESTISGLSGIIKRVEELSDEFENLRNNTNRNNEEQQRFYDLQNELKALMPNISGFYDEQGNFILTAGINLTELNKQRMIEIQLAKDQLVLDKERQAQLSIEAYNLATKKEVKLVGSIEIAGEFGKSRAYQGDFQTGYEKDLQSQLKEQQNIKTETIQMLTELYMVAQKEGEVASNAFMQMIIDSAEDGKTLLTEVLLYANDLAIAAANIGEEMEQAASPESLLAHMDAIYQNATAVRDLINGYDELNGMTIEQAQSLQTMFPLEYQEAMMIDQTTGLVYLNIQALKALVVEKAQAAFKAAEHALALDTENVALQRMLALAKGYLTQVKSTSFWLPKVSAGVSGVSDAQKTYNDLLKDTISMLKQQANDQKDALKAQLDGYKKIIDAKKKILDQMQEEDKYQDELAEKNEDLSDIENELLQIQFDNSDEAKRRRLELEDEKAKKITEIDQFQADRSVDIQKDALDEEYDRYEDQLSKKIDALDDYLKREGAIRAEAISLLESRNQEFYNNLMEWNRQYGSGIDDLAQKWNNATNSANSYGSAAANAMAAASADLTGKQSDYQRRWYNNREMYQNKITGTYISLDKYSELPKYHDGGIVGRDLSTTSSTKENEVLANVLKEEVIVTENQAYNFIRNTLPGLLSLANKSGETNVPVSITIEGNVDKNVMPELKENITKAVYQAITKRGVSRNAKDFSL